MRVLLSIIAICLLHISSGQISGEILDASNHSPVTYASIQLVNTNTGTVSDEQGNFNLVVPKNTQTILLITHVSYKDKLVQISNSKTTVYLEEKTTSLEDVSVNARPDRFWKKSHKKFKSELFGVSAFSKKIEIINPWIINYEEQAGALVASADDPLKIVNNYTGYKINFILESFINKGLLSTYQGKPFFTNLEGNYDSNREEVFFGSRRHFLFTLIHGNTRAEGFRVYKTKFDRQTNSFITVKALNPNKLIANINNEWWLDFEGYIKVVYLKEKDPTRMQHASPIHESGQISYLVCNRKIKIDELGNTHNPGLQDFGYWANVERVGHWLPHDYLPARLIELRRNDQENKRTRPDTLKGFVLSNLIIPADEIMDGGVPRDGIRSLITPKVSDKNMSVPETTEVLGVRFNGQARAYPVKILNFHEAVNDTLGGIPIVVTFCPLCGSGVSFVSKTKEESLTFGISGLLYNSDVLLYDHQTESLWSQLMGKAISGPLSGEELEQIPTDRMTWEQWEKLNLNTTLGAYETKYPINYEQEPYREYLSSDQLMFPVNKQNRKIENKEMVIGVTYKGKYKAYPFAELKSTTGKIEDILAGEPITIHFNKESNKAWLSREDWDKGVKSTVLFWFAWYAFHPETEIYKN